VDKVTAALRSENMRRIQSCDTSPELAVRRFIHRAGFRFSLHRRDLPGKPDLVFPSLRACVFVHGCFWHGCDSCIDGTRRVKSHSAYWKTKVAGNRRRDAEHIRTLKQLGWKVYVIWECETKAAGRLKNLADWLALRRAISRETRSMRFGECRTAALRRK
jgi:DNA mismatch endonuclease (patch repair protein)